MKRDKTFKQSKFMAFLPGQCANPAGRLPRRLMPFSKRDIQTHFLEWKRLVTDGEMSDLQRMHGHRMLVEFMCDRLYGKPAQAVALTTNQPLAAVVNITLGADGDNVVDVPLTPLGRDLLIESKPCLVHENNSSREVTTEKKQLTSEPGCASAPPAGESADVPEWLE